MSEGVVELAATPLALAVTSRTILGVVALVVGSLAVCWIVLRIVLKETMKASARFGPPDRSASAASDDETRARSTRP